MNEEIVKFLLDICMENHGCKMYLMIIVKLFEKPGLSLRALAREVNIASKNLIKWLDKLISKNLVTVHRTQIERLHFLNINELTKKYGITQQHLEQLKELVEKYLQK